ncbi:MAG: glycoside hydrolase family 5 protein [Prevotella sp.]|nr:glycoside hydrolase family 5 protein [Prevotella sp.]
MKRLNAIAVLAMMIIGLTTGLAACGGDDEDDPVAPKVTISLRSCSITEGTEYTAPDLMEVTLSYNNVVAVSPSANITLNGTKCTAKSSTTTAMDVIVTLPALEEGKSYTLDIPAGSIVSKADATASAPAYQVSFTTKAAPQPIDNDATALTKKLGWGWNLGNHFDTSSGEDGKPNQWGWWDNATPTQMLYTNLKKAGASTVRICVTWGNYQTADPWTIDANYMAEVKQNVEWAEAAGLNVILNMHHDEYWQDIKSAASNNILNDQIKDRIAKTWTQIAETFKDKGDFLFFESFNEVQDGQWGWGANRTDGGKQYNTLNEWNQTAVDAIRATGSKNATRWIGVPGYASSPTFVLQNSFKLPDDPANHIMVSVHFYDPSNFTLTPANTDGKTEWGHTAAAGKYVEGSNEDHVVETFQKLQEKFIANNIPVYIGEYGCVMQTTDRSNLFRNYYLEYVCRAAHTYNLPLCIWDNNSTGGGNEHHGYFNHKDGTYLNGLESLVQTMIKAATSNDASYTLESIYNKAP